MPNLIELNSSISSAEYTEVNRPSVDQVLSLNKHWDMVEGIYNSKLTRTFLRASVVAVSVYFLLSPPGWLILASGITLLAIEALQELTPNRKRMGLSQIPEMRKYEFMMRQRSSGTWYNYITTNKTIYWKNKEIKLNGHIILGALPNRDNKNFKRLLQNAFAYGKGAILSINEEWERGTEEHRGTTLPITSKQFNQLGVNYKSYDQLDHSLVEFDILESAADYIHEQISSGKNIYVHCVAGKGRSSQCIAAYLIKYHGFSAQESVDFIKSKRSVITITSPKKIAHLTQFENWL